MAINGKIYNWDDVTISLFGVEMKGLISINFNYTLAELEQKLKEALDSEHYEICADLKNEIDKIKNIEK